MPRVIDNHHIAVVNDLWVVQTFLAVDRNLERDVEGLPAVVEANSRGPAIERPR